MAITGNLYAQAFQSAFNKEIDFDSDTLKWMLTTSSYAPNRAADRYKSAVTNEVTGTGYTAGGATAAGTINVTAANSWVVARAASTAYGRDQYVKPASGNGFVYRALTAGTTDSATPTWPTTIGATVVDGGVTWVCEGTTVFWLDTADVVWPSSYIAGARYAVLYDATAGSDATRPLIALVDFGQDLASYNASFTLTIGVDGVLVLGCV